ncbi:hypothetical protein AWC19_19060 [Mycobacterium palustre]|uniref:PE family protein n=1 Tax=Mycobacterium palustre TaxID=153971 RepID=A0A1X1Z4Z5_9MYCO|nr:hypothetical protein AWC19_19060 [Mycobacterium palustre]
MGTEAMTAAATDLANIGSTISEANAAAAPLTTGLVPAAEDEVSVAIASLFGRFGDAFHGLNAQAAVFHRQLVQAVNAAVGAYSAAEAANMSTLQTGEQNLLNAVNVPAELLLGRPLVGNPAGSAQSSALGATVHALGDPVGTTLVMGGSGNPGPATSFINAVNKLFIQTTAGLQGSVPQGLTTPEQMFPFGLQDLTLNTSVSRGVEILNSALQQAIANQTPIGVFGYSQSAVIASLEMAKLQAAGVPSSAVHFVLTADLMNPNGGIFERFAGLQLSALGINFAGATPSNAYPTTIYTAEYDGWADFPRYPLDILSDFNAFLSQTHFSYPNMTLAQINSAIQLPTSGATQTTYYMIPTTDLPLVDPIRGSIPVFGNAIADLLQPDLRYLVNLGYGDPLYGWSTSPANVPTPAGLLPPLSAFQELPGLLTSGAQQGVQNFIGDLTGTGPHPLTLASLSSAVPSLPASTGTAGVTTGTADPLTVFSAVAANPGSLGGVISDYLNSLPGDFANASGAVRATGDIAYAALIDVPSYDVSLFLDGIQEAVNGQPVTGLINAFGLPLVDDVALYPLLWQFETGALGNVGIPLP